MKRLAILTVIVAMTTTPALASSVSSHVAKHGVSLDQRLIYRDHQATYRAKVRTKRKLHQLCGGLSLDHFQKGVWSSVRYGYTCTTLKIPGGLRLSEKFMVGPSLLKHVAGPLRLHGVVNKFGGIVLGVP